MIISTIILISTFFSLFVLLDTISLFPRKAGATLGKNALGYSFLVMINTLKRIFIVLYPPILGLLAMQSGINDFTKTIAISHLAGAGSILLVYLLRNHIIKFFSEFISSYASGTSLPSSLIKSMRKLGHENESCSVLKIEICKIRMRIALPALFIFFFYSSSGFIINIFAVTFSNYASFILQLIGIINAFGTLMMAFVLDPMISNIFEKGDPDSVVIPSLYFAQLANIAFVSPLILILITMAVS